MAGGEVCKEVFKLVTEPLQAKERLDIPLFSTKECCFKMPVLAEEFGDNYYRNDRHSILKSYDSNLYSSVWIYMEKYENGGWVEKDGLFDDTYGALFFYGFETNSKKNRKYLGYYIEWQKVLNTFGEGTYRFRFDETDAFGNTDFSFYYFEFCLKKYLPHRADRTVRFDWYSDGYNGDFQDDYFIWDLTRVAKYVKGDGWFNQMRLPDSWFGDNKSDYEREYVRYSNGKQVWIQDEQVEKYSFHSGMFPSLLHDYIKTEILQANRVLVSDYNSKNPNIIVDKAVKPSSSYEPSWNYNNLRAMVTVEFEQEFQNRRKKRC